MPAHQGRSFLADDAVDATLSSPLLHTGARVLMSCLPRLTDVYLPQTVAPCDPWTTSATMTSASPRPLVGQPLTRPFHCPEHSKRTSNTLHSGAPIPGMPQARASSIIMSLARCKDAATRLQGLQRIGSTGKRHLSTPGLESWQHGEQSPWHNRVVSHLLFQTKSALIQS